MPLTDLAYLDLVSGTLRNLGRMKFQQIAQTITNYEIFPIWFKKDKVMFDSGIGIQRTLMNRLTGAAGHVGLLEPDDVNLTDVLTQLQIPWVHARTSWGFIRQQTLMNRGDAQILDIVEPQRAAAMISLVEELETKGWAAPASTDTVNPFGVPYWIVKNASTGFNGGLPGSWATVGGVNLTNTPTFKNYTAQYVSVTKGDLIKKMRTGRRKTGFKSPVDVADYTNGKTEQYRIYMNEATVSSFEDVGESQNENLGRDVASMEGGAMAFRGSALRYVPILDGDTQNPVYMIDHSTFMPVCLKGDYLRESDPAISPHVHNFIQVFVDLTYNYLCVDRRRNAVFATA